MSVISKFKLFYKIPSRRLLHVDDILVFVFAKKIVYLAHITIKSTLRNAVDITKAPTTDSTAVYQNIVHGEYRFNFHSSAPWVLQTAPSF